MIPDLLPALRAIVYFEQLPDAMLRDLAQHLQRHTFEAGKALFFEGEDALGMWMIEHGRVKIYKMHPNGNEHVLRILGDGNTFNDIAALDGHGNPANASALSDGSAWVLPSTVLQNLIRSDAVFAYRVIQILTGRVRGLVHQIEDLSLYSVMARLARFLLTQGDDPALSGPGVTRATIAAHLATTPQTVSTALRELELAGAIQFDRHRIVIVRADILKSIALV